MAIALSRSTFSRGWTDFVYVSAGLPLGLAWGIGLNVALAVGVSLAIVTVGIPLLAITMLIWRWGADTERQRAALVLGAPIARPLRAAPASHRFLDRWLAKVRDRTTWRDLGYMWLLGPVGVVAGSVSIMLWSAAFAALLAPAVAAAAPDGSLLDELGTLGLAGVAVGSVLVAAARSTLPTRGCAGSSATCTTAPSTGSPTSRWSWAAPGPSCRTTRTQSTRCWPTRTTSPSARCASCATSCAASTPRS
jgi:hypothetical protein